MSKLETADRGYVWLSKEELHNINELESKKGKVLLIKG